MSKAKSAEGAQVSAYGGGTGIAVPLPLQSLGLPGYLELGVLYKVCYLISGPCGLAFHSSLALFVCDAEGHPYLKVTRIACLKVKVTLPALESSL